MDLTIIQVKTYGLYTSSGPVSQCGMDSRKAKTWREFWKGYTGIFWKSRLTTDAVYLVTTSGGGMIHPEFFWIPVLDPRTRLTNALNELDAAFKSLSRQIGFAYRISTISSTDIDMASPVTFSTEIETPTKRKEQT